MRRVATMLTAAAVVLFAAGMTAQSKANFSGKWTLDPASAPQGGGGGGRGGGRGGGWGQTFTITQDATTLKVERTQGQTPVTETFKLDGSDSKNSLPPMREGGAATDVISKASWDGDKIVITSSRTMNFNGNEMKIDTKRVMSMAGADLQIESTTTGIGDAPQLATLKYKKG